MTSSGCYITGSIWDDTIERLQREFARLMPNLEMLAKGENQISWVCSFFFNVAVEGEADLIEMYKVVVLIKEDRKDLFHLTGKIMNEIIITDIFKVIHKRRERVKEVFSFVYSEDNEGEH